MIVLDTNVLSALMLKVPDPTVVSALRIVNEGLTYDPSEQPAYPRALAGSDLTPIEAYMGDIAEFAGVSPDPAAWPGFLLPARRFLGNETMGYKMALCERDIAIYAFVLIGGLIYAVLRRRGPVRPMPFVAFVIIGLGPIALDGFSQLISQYGAALGPGGPLSSLLPLRESSPFLRTLTGALFGFSLVWLTYPRIDGSQRGPRRHPPSE